MLLEVMSPFQIPLVSILYRGRHQSWYPRLEKRASGTKLRIHKLLFELVAVAVEFGKRHTVYAYAYTRDPEPGKESACLGPGHGGVCYEAKGGRG